ncbi:MAG: acyl-CoA dehydrogenase family protein [Longimicrobiales bacterium]
MSTTAPERKVSPQTVTERDARAVAEAARETEWAKPSFVRELFLGRLRMDVIDPMPAPDPHMEAQGRAFLDRLDALLRTDVDVRAIEREARIPPEVLKKLAAVGAFGIKIPQQYGGLGLSQRWYNRAIALVSSQCTAMGVLLSAHQSIGVPQPLKMFGTEAQKKKYLPRLAAGEVSAFALTEADVGSDPARMEASADPAPDGNGWILNGEKLWCTNGPIADVMVVMARTPPKPGSNRRGITAFIVETSWEGVSTSNRCTFMGLNGIENGIIRFDDVRVPAENLLWAEGKGLKLALITLNTGRLTIPATCAAAGKWCLKVVREWSNVRKQWGASIGKHDAIAQKIAYIGGVTFAMDAIAEVSAALADAGDFDIRLEAAIAKMFNSEAAWRIADETMQIRGGRGYETAESLEDRGEAPIAVERVMRDLRINLIFEGSSEIMRLFIAREAVDPHLQKAGAMADPDSSAADKARSLVGLSTHMAGWYGGNVAGWGRWPRYADYGRLAPHIRYAERHARKLARTLAYAMARFGPALEKRQSVLFRLVDIGAELFAIAAACTYARHLSNERAGDRSPALMADAFCRGARRRIDQLFEAVFDNDDAHNYRFAQSVLGGEHRWIESGIVPPPAPGELAPRNADGRAE